MLTGLGVTATRVLGSLLAGVLGVLVLALVLMGALAWRLSDGPLDVSWLAQHVAPAGWSANRVTLQIVPADTGHALRVQLAGGTRAAMDGEPAQSVASATASLALAPLLAGRLAPRDVALEGLRLRIQTPRPGSPPDTASPGFDPRDLLARLHHLGITHAQVDIAEGTLGQEVTLRIADGAADRGPDGILQAHAAAEVSTGTAVIQAAAQGSYGPDGAHVQLSVPSLNPATLAQAVPALAAAAGFDAAVALQADAAFGPDLAVQHAGVHVQAGPGTVQLPAKKGGTSPGHFAALTLDADGTPATLNLRSLKLALSPASGNPATNVTLSGTVERADTRFTAHLGVDIDQVALADLGSLWPEGVGGGARDWLVQNLTAGAAHDGHATLTLAGAADGSDLDVTQAGGSLTGDDVTLWWLRPVPPVQHAHAALAWQTPDVLLITMSGGQDSGIDARAGTVRITGLAGHDQMAMIDADLAGGLPDVVALLRQPRLKLLSQHPIPLTAPSGAVIAHLSVRLPLEAKVTIEQVAIHATGQVANAHLGGIAVGRDLDRGQLAIDVSNDGLSITGPADIGHIPAQLGVQMDFRAGPPTQIVQHITAGLRITRPQAERAGLGVIGLEGGVLAAAVDYAERRDGRSTIQLNTDLKEAKLVTPLGWSKAAGTPGSAAGRALLDHGRVVGLDGLQAEAPGLSVVAHSDLVNGYPSVVHLERGEIGRSSATGTITLPQHEGEPYRVTLAGPRLDLEGRLTSADAPAASAAPETDEAGKPGTPYVLDLRFERVVLGPNHGLGPITLTASGAGNRLGAAHLVTGGPERARADLVAAGTGRRLNATVADLGALLRDTDLATEVNGGAVTLEGVFDDHAAGSPFIGTFDLQGFKVQGAPTAGKLLQALTLYGVVDALRGPGLAFDRFETPFRLHGSVLDVENARAYSSSLGFTANGRLDFGRKQVDLTGTIVPAYFFNSLPGRIPLVGRLFSPEQGSGLFAANYTLRGSVSAPSVSINPLSALTPGFTRRFFDLFK